MNNIHVVCSEHYDTARLLATLLEGTSGTEPVFGKFNVAFGWGFGQSVLNHNAIIDKAMQLLCLSNAGVNTPEVLLLADMNEHGGSNPFSSRDSFPLLGRKRYHTQGRDIVYAESPEMLYDVNDPEMRVLKKILASDFIVRFVPKVREFRVHVCGGRWVSVAEKKPDDTPKEGLKKVIWAKRNGYYHSPLSEADPLRNTIGSLGVRAAKTLHFDFGAVDIILGEDEKLYVLEVNSAPSLNNRRAAMYAKYIMEEYETWRRNNNETQ